MRTLILETSSIASCFTLGASKKVLVHQPLVGGPSLSQSLPSEIACLFEREAKPDCIAIGTGPGSSTGIRVGLALARSLAFGWEIPCMEFSSFLGYSSPQGSPFALLINAYRAGVYLYRSHYPLSTLPIPLDQLPSLLDGIPTLLSPHPEAIALPGYTIDKGVPNPHTLLSLVGDLLHNGSYNVVNLRAPPLKTRQRTCPLET